MDILDHSDNEEQQSRYAISGNSRFGKRQTKRRSESQQHLLLMDCVGGSDNGDASEETVPLPDYERLSQSARLADDSDHKDPPPPPLTPAQQQKQTTPAKTKREASSPPPPPPPPPTQQQKPAAWRLLEYVRSRNKAGGAGVGSGCGASDGDSKSSEDGEREGEDGGESKDKKKKKRSSWLPDPERRWPVQGFY